MTILIVDDHDVIRLSLGKIIEAEFPRATCAVAGNAESCLEQLAQTRFDLLILDINLPDQSGFELTERIRAAYPEQMILIFSMNAANLYAKRLYQLGVMGYLSKQADIQEIRKALRMIIIEQKTYIDPDLKNAIALDSLQKAPENPVEKLSKRELSIAQFLATGRTIEEIAGRLNVGTSTIRTYKARIFQKLDVSNLHEFLTKARLYRLA